MNDALHALKNGNLDETADILLTYYDKAYLNSFEKKKDTEWIRIESDDFSINSIAEQLITKAYPQTSEANYDR
jgi:hypothetical protein